ncbi:Rho termination factor N-terminal domain-containing protein, partial [Thiobacillus sp.]|uniref:Rho termination factor N-terminal domain-containing protein n=1 Tax=Thiobacillus sp. TaxID=924 RepID=UPI00286E5730
MPATPAKSKAKVTQPVIDALPVARPEGDPDTIPSGSPLPHPALSSEPLQAPSMYLSELKLKPITELLELAATFNIDNANRFRKQELIFAILKAVAKRGDTIFGDGVLEVLPDGFGFLRSPETSYLANTDDIYVSPSQIRRFNLHTGDKIEG